MVYTFCKLFDKTNPIKSEKSKHHSHSHDDRKKKHQGVHNKERPRRSPLKSASLITQPPSSRQAPHRQFDLMVSPVRIIPYTTNVELEFPR